MKKFLILAVFLVMIAMPLLASAQNQACSRSSIAGNNSVSTFPKCISQIYIWSLGIAALLALLMTVTGAYKYMTAAGNAEKAQSGTEMIWGAIIGLALLFGAYLLLNTINPDLVNFRIGGGTCIQAADGQPVYAADRAGCEGAGNKWYQVTESLPVGPTCNPANMTCLPTTPTMPTNPTPAPTPCNPANMTCLPTNTSPLGQ